MGEGCARVGGGGGEEGQEGAKGVRGTKGLGVEEGGSRVRKVGWCR